MGTSPARRARFLHFCSPSAVVLSAVGARSAWQPHGCVRHAGRRGCARAPPCDMGRGQCSSADCGPSDAAAADEAPLSFPHAAAEKAVTADMLDKARARACVRGLLSLRACQRCSGRASWRRNAARCRGRLPGCRACVRTLAEMRRAAARARLRAALWARDVLKRVPRRPTPPPPDRGPLHRRRSCLSTAPTCLSSEMLTNASSSQRPCAGCWGTRCSGAAPVCPAASPRRRSSDPDTPAHTALCSSSPCTRTTARCTAKARRASTLGPSRRGSALVELRCDVAAWSRSLAPRHRILTLLQCARAAHVESLAETAATGRTVYKCQEMRLRCTTASHPDGWIWCACAARRRAAEPS